MKTVDVPLGIGHLRPAYAERWRHPVTGEWNVAVLVFSEGQWGASHYMADAWRQYVIAVTLPLPPLLTA